MSQAVPRRWCRLLAAAALLSSPLSAAIANLLVNPTFDANVGGWAPTGNLSWISHTTENADGAHPAGSALVGSFEGFQDVIAQCVPVTGGAIYTVAGDIFVRPGTVFTGMVFAKVGLQFYSSPSCSGGPLTSITSEAVDTASVWSRRTFTLNAPAAATSAAFHLIVTVQEIQYAQFDNLILARRVGGDADADGDVDVVDVFYLINFLFAGGPAPPLP
jgi:hypothetical protein